MALQRRHVLALSGSVLAGLAGCIGDDGGDENGTGDQPSGQPTDDDQTPGDGKQNETDALNWTYDIGGSIATVVDGVLYGRESFNEGAGGLLALDAETGKRLWRYGEAGGYSMFTRPVVDDGVYAGFGDDAIGSGNGEVYALAPDGSERWVAEIGSVYHPPRLTEDSLYVGSDDGTVYCLDRATGDPRWTVSPDATDGSGPLAPEVSAVSHGVVVVELDERVLGLDAADGAEHWQFESDGERITSISVSDQTYLTTNERVYALAGGEQEWSRRHGGGRIDAVAHGNIYLTGSSRVAAFDAIDGTQRWFVRTEDHPELRCGSSTAYFGTTGVRALAPDGETRWETALGERELQSLVSGEDGIYAGTEASVSRLDGHGTVVSEYDGGGTDLVVGERVYAATNEQIVGLSL